MGFTFENQGTNTYLTYSIDIGETVDTMSLGMLTNNKIPGLASTIFTQMDNLKYIKYNVSAKVSVKQFFNGPVNKKRLTGVFSGIVDAMLSAEEYMIDCNSILLDLDYIFADVSSCETVLICLPIEQNNEASIDLGMFFKNIMFTTQFDQTENCDHVAKIINYLNNSPVFSLLGFKDILNEIKNTNNANDTTGTPAFMSANTNSENNANKNNVINSAEKNSQKFSYGVVETKRTSEVKVEAVTNQPVVTSVVSQESVHKSGNVSKTDFMNTPVKVNDSSLASKKNQKKKESKTDQKEEKKMSMFYLLQHYNKENAAIYKAQKSAQKNFEVKTNSKTNKTSKEKNTAPVFSFEVPSQTAPTPVSVFTQPEANKVNFSENRDSGTVALNAEQVQKVEPEQLVSTPTANYMNFGETTVLGGGVVGETTVLNNASDSNEKELFPYLIRVKTNEKIQINKPIFRIGKERSYVDYFISDNTAISRSHANLIVREKRYFITDTNSTNHTYVDGKMVPSNAEVEICNGSKIRLANEEFEFILT